ncbi:MAG: hypothetical protein MUD16_08085 [Desulfobacterales bacterium]|nr:hypothetical protein [Desulfobacterales bacterium]
MTAKNRRTSFACLAHLVLPISLAFILSGPAAAHIDRAPEPDPPVIVFETAPDPGEELQVFSAQPADPAWKAPAAATEWTYHKTADNLHPDGNEQQMMWLMNRARSNPAQEGVWLAAMPNSDVAAARSHFGVNLEVLRSEFAALAPKPPAAFDVRLYNAAKSHSNYLISIDGQTHTGQLERVDASGFARLAWAGIVFSYSYNPVYGHAAFNIDWGSGTDGTQDPPGHRYAIMSVNGNWTNVGYAVVPENNSSTDVGPQVITGNFCYADTAAANHFNRFIVGTVWEDTNANGQYDPGEGLAGVTVMPDKGTYYAVTAAGGGYAIPITAADTYTVTFAGGELVGTYLRSVAVAANSVLLDLEYFAASSTTPPPVGDSGSGSGSGSSGGGGGGGGCFIQAAHPPEGLPGVLIFVGPGLLGLMVLGRRARR